MARPAWADQPVRVLPWSPAWRVEAARLADGVLRASGGAVRRIGHVGSTAVVGLAAKPVLDLLAHVEDPEATAALVDGPLRGWHLVPPDLDERPWRRLLVLPHADGRRRKAHLHLVRPDHASFAATLRFRDRLRADPPLAASYAELKRDLADRHRDDREAYTAGKTTFVEGVLADDGPTVLSGGAIADPVRLAHPVHGDVVARRRHGWSPAVEALLDHLDKAGLPVPRPVGVDDHGRALHRWVAGDTHHLPATPEEAGAVGGLLRALHEATRSFVAPADPRWAGDRVERRPGQVIGHGDVAPGNVAWRDGAPVGLLDLDHAEPRWPAEDLAEAAWQLVLARAVQPADPGRHGVELAAARDRLAGLCLGYGDPRLTPVAVLDALGARLREERRRVTALVDRWPYDLYAARGDDRRHAAAQRWLAHHRRDLL